MARMSDYESIIFDAKHKSEDAINRLDSLEIEFMRYKTKTADEIIDLKMEIKYLREKLNAKEG